MPPPLLTFPAASGPQSDTGDDPDSTSGPRLAFRAWQFPHPRSFRPQPTTCRSPSTASSETCAPQRSSARTERSTGSAGPHFDSPSVFAAILDAERGGHFRLAPVGEGTTKQLYFPDTNVLDHALPLAGRGSRRCRTSCRRRTSAAADPPRGLRARRGALPARVRAALQLRTRPPRGGRHSGRGALRSPSLSLALSAPVPLLANSTGAYAEFALTEGESRTFVLEEADEPRPRRAGGAGPARGDRRVLARLDRAVDVHRPVARDGQPLGPLLKLLTFAPTGAIVAAATTSLPEQLGGGRNWDYRYTWIRDAAFSLYALLRLGFTQEAEAFGAFIGMCARIRRLRRGPAAADVRDRRPYGPAGARALAPRGLHGLLPCADRQRRRRPAPARHLRRDARRRLGDGAVRSPADAYEEWIGVSRHRRLGLRELADRPTRASGRPAAARKRFTHSRADVLGRARPRDPDRDATAPSRATSCAGCGARRDLPLADGASAGARSARRSSSTRAPTYWMRQCC